MTEVQQQIRRVLLRDSLIFGIGTILVLGAFFLGRIIHTWLHGLCNCTPGLLLEYGPSSLMMAGAGIATLWTLGNRSRARLLTSKRLKQVNDQLMKGLEAAASVQRSFLPEAPPDVEGLRFAWHFEPCEELAGDIFNLFYLDDRTVAVYSLDVSGHGVASALLSVTLNRILLPLSNESSIIRRCAGRSQYRIVPPSKVVELLNQQFIMNPEEPQYFTIVYGLLDIETKIFRFVDAGHPGPLHVPAHGQTQFLEEPGYPVGLFEEADWKESSFELCPGDRLYLYSDGITEAMNSRKELFGKSRLADVLSGARENSLEESIEMTLARVHEFGSSRIRDDISLIALEVTDAAFGGFERPAVGRRVPS